MILDFKNRRESYRMIINLDELMHTRSISRMRKVVKYIQESDAPEEIGKIQTWIGEFLSVYDDVQKDNIGERKALEAKAAECEKNLERILALKKRRGLGCTSPVADKELKGIQAELRSVKRQVKIVEKKLDEHVKLKEFVEKVSGVLNG